MRLKSTKRVYVKMKNRKVIYLISLEFRSGKPFKLQMLNNKNSRYLNVLGRWSSYSYRRKTSLIYWESQEAADSAVSEILRVRDFASKSVSVVEFKLGNDEVLAGLTAYNLTLSPCLGGYIIHD